jgi:hypothetical protein
MFFLQEHRDALEAIRNFTRNHFEVDRAALLEISELRDFLAVEPDFPAEAPGAERRRFPVVFNKTDIVRKRVDADRAQTVEISSCEFSGAGFMMT